MADEGQDERFTVDTARAAAEQGTLDEWVARFLASPGSDNADLADQLGDRVRLWAGPMRLPFEKLHRLAGPPGDPVLVTWDEDDWRDDVEDLAEKVDDGWEPPPVVVTYRNGQLVLEDGNHRVEGMRRTGQEDTWAIVGFDTAEERDGFDLADAR